MNQELPRVSSWLSKRQRNQRSNCKLLLDPREREIQRNLYLCFIELAKAFDCVDHNKLWKTLKEMGIPNHLTCLLRNLYAGHEATVRTFCGTTDWFKIEKAVWQAVSCHPVYLAFTEHIMWNAGLDELQAEIKIARRNINNLRYADDTALMAENEEELKSFLMRVKDESEKAGLKLNIKKLRSWHLVPLFSGTSTSWKQWQIPSSC